MEFSLLPGLVILEKIGIEPNFFSQNIPIEKLDHYIAIINWLTDYHTDSNSTHRQKLEGYLQALHHLCDAQDWKKASDILSMPLSLSSQQPFHQQLGIWGYYIELIDLYKKLLDKIDLENRLSYLCGLGNVYYNMSHYPECLEFYNEGLEIAKRIDHKSMKAQILNNLGSVNLMCGNYPKAIKFYKRSLRISQKISERHLEYTAHLRLGLAYIYQRQYYDALECYQKELVKIRKDGDAEQESIALVNLGLTYICLEDYSQAIFYNQQALEVAQKIGHRTQEAWANCNLGKTLLRTAQYQKSEEYLKLALKTFQEMDCRRAQSEVLETLSELYEKMNLPILSSQCYGQALAICEELGISIINPTSRKLNCKIETTLK
jgi:tetratricopeptide (TPR) repeat protein